MKKVLMMAYYYPPAGGAAVQRALKFTKYLPEFGWTPVVLTARPQDYVLTDPTLETAVPRGTRVIRSPAPDLYRLYGRLSGRGSSGLPDLAAIAARSPESIGDSTAGDIQTWLSERLGRQI